MQEHDRRNDFKRPPKKYAPKGVTILYEDRDIIVVDKDAGLLVTENEKERDKTAMRRLTDYVTKGNPKSRNRLYLVHRLDREASGVVVFAKTPEVRDFLSKQWSSFEHFYKVAVCAVPEVEEGEITSYLSSDGVHKVYVTNKSEGKLASLKYKVAKSNERRAILDVESVIERGHHIRVQLASKGMPISGDKKYGEKVKGAVKLALHSSSVTIRHPFSKLPITFTAPMPGYFESALKGGV